MARRVTEANAMHGMSSRSHCFLTIFLDTISVKTQEVVQKASFLIIDLAGTEKVDNKSLNFVQARHVLSGESDGGTAPINTGNLVLARVLEALATCNRYVPYRDSLLTRLLKPALNGDNWSNTMLACLQPGEDAVVETAKVLGHASLSSAGNEIGWGSGFDPDKVRAHAAQHPRTVPTVPCAPPVLPSAAARHSSSFGVRPSACSWRRRRRRVRARRR